MDEVAVTNGGLGVVEECPGLKATQPLLAVVDLLLAERQLDAVVVVLVDVAEGDAVLGDVREVLFCLLGRAGSQTWMRKI